MRRPLIVVAVLALLIVAAIVAAHLRPEEPLIPPERVPEMPMVRPARAVAPATTSSLPQPEPELTPEPEQEGPPANLVDSSFKPSEPPAGCIWWGNIAFRKDARIQSNYVDHVVGGYAVPVQYANDGTLIVASKYGDHTACIWSYDTATAKFAVLHQKTRQAVEALREYETCDRLGWREKDRQCGWNFYQSPGKPHRDGVEIPASRSGGARGDQCYAPRYGEGSQDDGFFMESSKSVGPRIPLNGGALELVSSCISSHMTVPILDYRVVESEHRFTTVYDPVAKKSLSTIDGCVYSEARWDFGRGLALFFDLGVPFTNIVLIAYPDLRIIAKGSLNENSWKLQLLPSTRDGLAVDVVTEVPRTWGRDAAPGSGNTAPARSGLYHIRVPDNWRTAPGRRYTDCIREEHPSGLVELEVTELGTFDVAKYDALQYAAVEGDPIPENLIRPYAFRDGVMYWRKRHTGEVVMAAVDNLDAQTVIGGEGATWDGFRVNPARDEVVTWRENGELVFWKVQFPTAEPLCKARVITDETPHRLEAM